MKHIVIASIAFGTFSAAHAQVVSPPVQTEPVRITSIFTCTMADMSGKWKVEGGTYVTLKKDGTVSGKLAQNGLSAKEWCLLRMPDGQIVLRLDKLSHGDKPHMDIPVTYSKGMDELRRNSGMVYSYTRDGKKMSRYQGPCIQGWEYAD